MSKRKGGPRAGGRSVFRKHPRNRGKISLTKYFMPYEVGDLAILTAEPAVQKNIYHVRFHGITGLVTGKRGSCYELKIQDGGKQKMLIVHPVHLKKYTTSQTGKVVAKPAAPKATEAPKKAVKKSVKKVAKVEA
jgi:large subunit ribosomal protein L21e